MAKAKTFYILIVSENPTHDWNHCSIFKSSDTFFIDLREQTFKTLEKHEGTFKRDSSIKGKYNGYEVGIFTSTTGEQFAVFKDHSAKKMEG